MKNINRLLLIPVLAAFVVGCSSPVAFQSSEYDDVYYSSKDKTTIQDRVVAVASAEEAESNGVADENAVPNPEYSEKNSGTAYSSRDYANTEDYYSNDYLYSSRRYAPYRSGLSYYDLGYNDLYWNRNPFMYGRSAFYDPFYASSFYDPFFNPYFDYGFGYPRVYNSLTLVLGRPYYGGLYGGYPYGGYGGGFNRGFYGGGGYNSYYANSGWYRNDNNYSASKVQYGPRRERSAVPTGNANTVTNGRPRGDVGGVAPGGGGGVVAPGGRGVRPANADVRSTRGRTAGNAETAPDVEGVRRNTTDMARPADSPERATRVGRQDRSTDVQLDRTAQPNLDRPTRRARVETNDYNLSDQPARSMEEQPSVRPRRERNTESYSQPMRTERQERVRETYRAEPTYEAPRRERSYEAPRSYDQPSSRPTPSYGGGSNDGGGSSGGRGGRPRN